MTTRVVENEDQRSMLVRFIEAHDLPLTVTITKGRRRSVAQNRLQQQLINDIAAQRGDTSRDEVRAELKLTIGVPILRNLSEDEATEAQRQWRETYDEFIRPMPYEAKIALIMKMDLPVTRLFTVKQKTAFLDEIYRRFSELGFHLTDPNLQGIETLCKRP